MSEQINDQVFEYTSALSFELTGVEGQILIGSDSYEDKTYIESVLAEALTPALKKIKAFLEANDAPAPPSKDMN